MKIVFFGTPDFAVPSLERLLQHPEFEVLGVVTQPDKRRGRGQSLSPSPVKAIALQHQIPVWQPVRLRKDSDTLAHLRASAADAFVVVAYGQLLSAEVLAMPRLGCINAHGSILPKYRGAAPIQWSLYHGEAETGITTMLMDVGMDTGAMLKVAKLPIGWLDHAGDIALKLAELSATLLIETLQDLEQQRIEPVPQDHTAATYAPLIQKTDYELDWGRPAIALHNQIRGFYPNAVTVFRDQPFKVLRTVPFGVPDLVLPPDLEAIAETGSALLDRVQSSYTSPGTVVGLLKSQGPAVQTGMGLLLLQEVQLAGKRPQSGWDFANGSRLEVGEILGDRKPKISLQALGS